MKIKLIVEGGEMKPGPAVSQQLGPMGINLGKVIADVNKETAGFKGVKVPVEIDVDAKTKHYTIQVFSPPMAEMVKKELGLESGSGEAGKTYVGNIAFENLIGIAKNKLNSLPARNLKSAVSMAVGTCVSMGVLIDSKNAVQVARELSEGVYDKEIKNEVGDASEEKKKELKEYFSRISSEQERKKKAAEDAKKAAEAEAAKTAVAPATGAAPTAEAAKKEEPAKKEKGKK